VPAATIRGCHFHFCVCDLTQRNTVFTFTFMADLAPPPAAAAAVVAAAVAPPPAPPDPQAALRARASFLGASLDVPEACLEKFVFFAEGAAPKIVFQEAVFLEKAATFEAAYKPYFKPVWDATLGRLKLKCVCCKTGPISYHVFGAKHTFPFANALDHLKRCPGLPPLLPEHIADRKGAKQEPPQPQPDKRVRILDGPVEHLGFLGLDQGQYRLLLLRGFLADAQPFSTVERAGFSNMLEGLKLPVPSRTTMRSLFDAEYGRLVLQPIQRQLAEWRSEVTLNVGGSVFTLMLKLQMGCDGWKGGGGHTFESVALKGPKVVTPVIMERVAGTMVMVPRKKLAQKCHFSLFGGVAPRHNRVLCFTFTSLTRGALEMRAS
jgi:hypothetical protein